MIIERLHLYRGRKHAAPTEPERTGALRLQTFGSYGAGSRLCRQQCGKAAPYRRLNARLLSAAAPLLRVAVHACLALAAALITACGPQKMASQPKYIPLRSTNFFEDGKSERPLVEGTVAHGFEKADAAFYTGKTGVQQAAASTAAPPAAGAPSSTQSSPGAQAAAIAANLATRVSPSPGTDVTAFPIEVTPAVFKRGQERFNIYCAPCHGMLGYGDGMVVRRGFRQPPSYHQDRLRQAPVGHFFDVITNGFGAMSDYAQQITPMDRWAIVAYIRALQTSQNSKAEDVPPEQRSKLDTGGQQ